MAVRALLNSFFEGAVRGFSDLTSSHPWQEKKAKKPEAATAEKVEKPKDLCSHCRSIFWGCKSLIWDRILNGCKSLIEQFFWGGCKRFF